MAKPLTHDDYAEAAQSAERGTAWYQAAALWNTAAALSKDHKQSNRYRDAAAQCAREIEVDTLLAGIARRELQVPTLDERKHDDLDFHEVDVWNLRRALRAAYRAGRDACKRES